MRETAVTLTVYYHDWMKLSPVKLVNTAVHLTAMCMYISVSMQYVQKQSIKVNMKSKLTSICCIFPDLIVNDSCYSNNIIVNQNVITCCSSETTFHFG